MLIHICSCEIGFKVSDVQSYKLLRTVNNSSLYQLILKNSAYQWPILLIHLQGTHYQMGYDYGYLLAYESVANYESLITAMLGTTWEARLIRLALETVLDWQWNDFLSKQVPRQYLDELYAAGVGGFDAGLFGDEQNLTILSGRGITLANLPATTEDFIYILLDEWEKSHPQAVGFSNALLSSSGSEKMEEVSFAVHYTKQLIRQKPQFIQPKLTFMKKMCSMFAVWGPRTVNGQLLAGRNLDWRKDTGIAKYKLIAVYKPNGQVAHATVGFAGLPGALAGMSAAGLTVHEANLEENALSWEAFPWILRLRYVMENAVNLHQALAIWNATKNTGGFNHMIGSLKDRKAVVLETMSNYTAYFYDNDPREQHAQYEGKQIGFPLPNALWRTNHGYDPVIRLHYLWSQSPSSWSMVRYMVGHDIILDYQNNGKLIGDLQAINITSALGDKGEHPYVCRNNTDGSNILSVAFVPAQGVFYVAWEDGYLSTWRPAACNTYVRVDLKRFWN